MPCRSPPCPRRLAAVADGLALGRAAGLRVAFCRRLIAKLMLGCPSAFARLFAAASLGEFSPFCSRNGLVHLVHCQME